MDYLSQEQGTVRNFFFKRLRTTALDRTNKHKIIELIKWIEIISIKYELILRNVENKN